MFKFEDGILVEDAYVIIDGKKYPVIMPEYEGNTPMTARNLNNLLETTYDLMLTSNVAAGGVLTLPFYYKVGANALQVYYMGQLLLLSSDDAGSDGHYREIGEADNLSNKIKLTTDWSAETGEYFKFVVKGVYENESIQ